MKKYEFQIKVKVGPGAKEWRSVHPTGGKPYQYDTREEAQKMLRICYPFICEEGRVIEVEGV